MTVISDSSPLIALSKIGRLELLSRLYQTVFVSPQVYAEVVSRGFGLAGSTEVANASWIVLKPVHDVSGISTLQKEFGLGMGEASTILLGKELKANLLLIDEIKARKVAQQVRLTVLGCVGVLEDAFGRRLFADLREAYRQLLASGAYIDPRILENSLRTLKLPPL